MKRIILIFAILCSPALVRAQTATINWTNVHQVIDGFGATDPLAPNANLTTAQRNLFFGTGSGQLGLSLVRFAATSNGGYGPGDCTTVSTSCAGSYVADMQALVAQGGRVFITGISPPAAYKTNGNLACSAGAGNGALITGDYANYATWLTNFMLSLKTLESINVYAFSIQNEPNNCPSYDGALWSGANFDTFVKTNLGPTFASNSISSLIFLPETENYSGLSSGGNTCFTDSSCYAFTGGADWHDYDATANSSGSVNSTPNLWSLGQKYWETETACGNGYGPSGCESGTVFVTDMTTDGLMWAGLLDNRIAVQSANAYQYFALVGGGNTDNLGLISPASATVPSRAYVFGQYSKFIRPGYFRIDATHNPQSGVAVSAYQNAPGGNLVIVATNYNGSPVTQTFSLTNAPTFTSVTPYVTSQTQNIAQQSAASVSGNSFSYSLPAQSVTTFTAVASASWTGILSPARAMDWRGNGATITNRTTQCGSTIAPYGTSGSPLSASTIINALAACPAGDFVGLGAGSFYLSSTLQTTQSNVTLRGMGPTQTFLVFMTTSTNCNGVGGTSVCIWNGDSSAFNNNGATTVNWTANYAQGTTQITLSGTSGLAVGKMIVLSQNDINTDPGNIWPCQTFGTNGDCSQQGGGGVAKAGASQTQNVTVTAISGNNVTIFPAIAAPNWSGAQSPTAWWSTNQPITGFGIENLTLDYSNLGEEENGIEFHNATNSWVKNIRSINNTASGGATHKHVNIYGSNHVTVRDSYFYGSSPTSEGYGVDNGPGSANNLTENVITQHMATGKINETSCCDTIGYTYSIDNFYNAGGLSPNWQQQDEFHHGAGDNLILFEGNQGIGFDGDDIHGTSFFITHFREYLSGHDPATESGAKNQATFAYFPFANNRYYNAVGGVFGTASYHTFYQNTPLSTTDCSGTSGNSALSVFVLGFGDQAGTGYNPTCSGTAFTINNDSLVASTLVRWGNYAACTGDANCNAVRWQSSETASAAPVYPGLASPSETLPASFYQPAKPAFWGSEPWPAVGPDVAGGNVPNVGGHANLNPAANCYLNILGGKIDGSTGPLPFDANTCYGSTPTVPTPTISPANGGYVSPLSVTITCAAGATCGYTTDGSTPTASSGTITHGTVYTGPFNVTPSSPTVPVVVQAIGSQAGSFNSGIASASYTLGYIVQSNGATTSSVPYSSNVAAGNALYAFATCGSSDACVVAFTSTNETGLWTAPIYAPLTVDNDRIALSCAIAQASAADTVSATGDGNSGNIHRMFVYESKGTTCNLDATSPAGGFVTSDSTQSSPISSPPITTTTDKDLMIYFITNANAQSGSDQWTVAAGFTNLICASDLAFFPACSNPPTGFRSAVAATIKTPTGSVTASINSTLAFSQEYGTIFAAFKPAGAVLPVPQNFSVILLGP